jgi:hypothetical protein
MRSISGGSIVSPGMYKLVNFELALDFSMYSWQQEEGRLQCEHHIDIRLSYYTTEIQWHSNAN